MPYLLYHKILCYQNFASFGIIYNIPYIIYPRLV